MSAPVDVLAVLDALELQTRRRGGSPSCTDISRARAAIAELIEEAAAVRAAHRELPSADHPAEVRQAGEARIGRAHYALESALARVKGGAA